MENELRVPNHIAIILDGNGRWAKRRGMPRGYGHIVGCDNLEKMCDVIKDMGVKYLTVYAFSTENWKRSRDEVEGLMKLFRQYLKRCIKKAHKNQMRVRIIGDPSAFPQDIQESIHILEDCSKDYDQMFFQIAMNYGSRDEILRGMTRMISDARDGRLPKDGFEDGKMTEALFESYLDTAGIPDPDLLIRTSGEQRLSNYLLWQLAYTEFYFTDVPWPDFHEEELRKAIEQYNRRDRRYGGVKEE
ncbi:MAG: polyprenyl diphosphate synthase [Fusicatenibacter sp.]